MIITIDGPAGTGKTTVAQKVAERLGYLYFDTGAMYRAITYQLMRESVNVNDTSSMNTFLKKFQFDIRSEKGKKRYFIGNEDVTESIRTSEVTQRVSEVSANPEIRKILVELQRTFGKNKNAVFEGRDMGTTVFPKAEKKIFLTARPTVRAERRYLEMKDQVSPLTEEEVMKRLLERDHFDSTREVSPLRQADDAYLIDTSDLTIDQVVDNILAYIQKKL